MQTTVRIALSCIPKTLKSLPIFIVINDTLQAKFSVHFECRKKLFDHTARKIVILCCDSWYPKGGVLEIVEKHGDLELIANLRSDSVLYDLPLEQQDLALFYEKLHSLKKSTNT